MCRGSSPIRNLSQRRRRHNVVLCFSTQAAQHHPLLTLHYTTHHTPHTTHTHTHTHTGCCAALEKGMSGSVGGGATSMLKLPNLTRLSPVTVWEVQHTAYQHVYITIYFNCSSSTCKRYSTTEHDNTGNQGEDSALSSICTRQCVLSVCMLCVCVLCVCMLCVYVVCVCVWCVCCVCCVCMLCVCVL